MVGRAPAILSMPQSGQLLVSAAPSTEFLASPTFLSSSGIKIENPVSEFQHSLLVVYILLR